MSIVEARHFELSVKKSLAWMGVAQALSFIAQFSSSVVLARYLTPHEVGIFAVGLATVGMLSILQNFGLQPLIVREKVLTNSITTTAFTINGLISVALSLLTILCAFLGSMFLREEGVEKVLLILSISPLFGILSFLPGAQLERNARFKETALISLATSIAGAAVTIVLAVMGFNYMSMAYANIISTAFLATLFCIVGWSHVSCRIGLSDWRTVSSFGVHVFAVSGIIAFSQRFCELALGRFLGLGALGLYNRASGLNHMLWGNIHYLIGRVALVEFARLHRAGDPIRDQYLKVVAIATAVLWPAFAGLALIAHFFIVLVYGKSWEAAAVPLVYLSIASAILVLNTMTWELCTVTDNVRTQTRVEATKALISIPLFIGGCLISLEAAAFSRIIDAALTFALYRPHVSRMSGTKFQDVGPIYAQSIVLTAIAVAPTALVLIYAGRHPGVALLASAVVIGIALWALMLFILKHPLAREVIVTLGNRFPRAAASFDV